MTTTPTLREAAQQFVQDYENGDLGDLKHYARSMRAALAEQAAEQAEPVAVPASIVAGAIFDFAGFLTTHKCVIKVGSTANASPVVERIKEWAGLRGLPLDNADVLSWQENTAPPAPARQEPLTDAARDVLAERQRQVSAEGWAPEHDDEHGDGSMSIAAACYALEGTGPEQLGIVSLEHLWHSSGWDSAWWKPKGRRRNLVKAAALMLAEIERLDRAAPLTAAPAEGGAA